MTLHVALTHRTSYRYDRAVTLSPQSIRLRPAPHARTPILAYSLKIEPADHFLNWQQDPQGNFVGRCVVPERTDCFTVTVDLVADMATINPFDFFLEPEAEQYPFAYDPELEHALQPFLRLDPAGPLLTALVAQVPRGQRATIGMLIELNRMVRDRVGYVVRMEPGVLTPEQTLAGGQGSCRDSAWLLVQLLRHLGYAARFVSGYLIQLRGDDGDGPAADFTDLHAWAEAYLPGAGWIGLDATSGLLAGEGHIPLAATPDPSAAAPISGGVEAAGVVFDVAMHVTRLRESPRTTKPYEAQAWQDILAAGRRVDRALTAGDVRLTMGGEPTFVAADDPEAEEWGAAALGPTKRRYAGRMLRRLQAAWLPGAALQYGQGKHYPGEQLPRWALHAHGRRDGEAVWSDPTLLADPDAPGDGAGKTAADAADFAARLAARLQVDPALVQPAYEDVHYFLWREQRLPANVVVSDAKLDDPLERARLARVFGGDLREPAGSVLPLQRVESEGVRRWQSGSWLLRGDTLFLAPGDSPIGARLPLTALPWEPEEARDYPQAPDPFGERARLQATAFRAQGRVEDRRSGRNDTVVDGPWPSPVLPSAEGTVRTALTVEARDGIIHVFLPPLYEGDDWLALVAAVEAIAAETATPVILEGYPPPEDERLVGFSVTPDPGVLEINVHPSASWSELVGRTEQLYEVATAEGLRAEKFMLDGRHVGTGGGHHVVLGAAEAGDSPFLRRPDLLASMLGFWHNHPSLSYLFSGLFIGPMSQHPRIDEARMDSVAELEIAFAQLGGFRQVAPWVTDRLFRNILVDMTGNTHRTEFCIDKMYAPEGPSGRRGLVELRAFEMPPHPQMAIAQALLTRSAVAAFWQRPYERRLIRWGTRLHDRFMLPHAVWEDLRDALEELGAVGFALDAAWFAPHFEFRFPRLGETRIGDIGIELRHALEPWHVLGEEPVAGGTVRYVDSAVERLQLRVENWVEERYVLACNGHAVPLAATDTQGGFFGGLRFKAWEPVGSLHPTIRKQTPLVIEVFDRWVGRSVGGFTHHVSHPGGRSYATFPVNANEAEARRRERFVPFGHSAGLMQEPRPVPGHEHPLTLDLRRAG